MNASELNTINNVPLVNSTQILAASAQVPMAFQIPVSASTPVVSPGQVVTSPVQTGYQTTTMNSHYATQTTLNTLVDEDYRLGRGILDDFRPNAYKTQIGVVGNTTTNVITSSTIPNVTTPVVTTAPVVSTTANVGGNNQLNAFL